MKNYFDPKLVQERKERKQAIIEEKISTYRRAIQDKRIQDTIDQMPKNQQTLDIIEEELQEIVKDIPANSERERWQKLMQGVNLVNATNSRLNGAGK